jgi:vacuolar-type H+-ATPase subunit I/STV1
MYGMFRAKTRQELIREILFFIIYVVILMFILRYLWNNALVKYTTVLKPVDSLFHMFILALAIGMFKA